MVFKILILAAILFGLYFIFFRKTSEPRSSQKKEQKRNSDEMLECNECGTFVSSREAIIKDGQFFCSKECAKLR
ncbi:MAG: Prokaryotic metallothionein [Sulfurospirillum sp.]|nr:Prokaryotic metallothionein [Sulfurospirillum sp.]